MAACAAGTFLFVTPCQRADLMAEVDQAFRTLPERYLGAEKGFDATWHVLLGDIGHSYEVRCTEHAARVRKGLTRRKPDVTIGTDAATWLALRQGELSGIEAFSQRTLYTRGNLDLAVGFEGMFRLPSGRPPLLRIHDVKAGRLSINTLTMGEGPDVLLIHGLGSTKASFLDTAAALSRAGYRVHAVDLPGFGNSSKPATASYGPAFFARAMVDLMDALEIDSAHLVGNSMGGRVSIELCLRHPDRVKAMALLCPAVAFVKRDFHHLVRLLRPELGMLPHSFGRKVVERQFWSLFADRDQVDPSVADVVVDEFLRTYSSPAARLAFLSSARSIYLESPYGKNGFYRRLSELEPPAMFVWSSHDKLIPAGFRRHVARWLPSAEHITIEGCGHAPQVEQPERTNGLLRRFFAHNDALGARPAASARARRAA
jgi:pimeloyl-ACP methyl ester carboxylesterase